MAQQIEVHGVDWGGSECRNGSSQTQKKFLPEETAPQTFL
jgi:hypothetical protein